MLKGHFPSLTFKKYYLSQNITLKRSNIGSLLQIEPRKILSNGLFIGWRKMKEIAIIANFGYCLSQNKLT
ncbi:hypothetical protein G9A89_016944 [Geosiphon pyriformis]|nr:hypothetical protein G9A89_016944 [Geosiphon pyriformis]